MIEIHKGMRLHAARRDAGITQDRMAELLGCSRRTITRWESDESAPPAVLMAYSMATDVNLEWLETGCTPRDLNPEPTDFGPARVYHLPVRLELAA